MIPAPPTYIKEKVTNEETDDADAWIRSSHEHRGRGLCRRRSAQEERQEKGRQGPQEEGNEGRRPLEPVLAHSVAANPVFVRQRPRGTSCRAAFVRFA